MKKKKKPTRKQVEAALENLLLRLKKLRFGDVELSIYLMQKIEICKNILATFPQKSKKCQKNQC